MFKFLHAADIHLDSPLRNLARYEGAPVERIRGAARKALQNLVDLALKESVEFVLIAGDVYDGDWKDYNTGLFFVGQMNRLREADIPVYLIAGNHDAQNTMTRSLRLPSNVHRFAADKPETKTLEKLGVAIHGQSYESAACKTDLCKGYAAPRKDCLNIGLLHTALEGRPGHEPYAPCSLEDLRNKQYQYWALGHVHKREKLCDNPPIAFPGNVQGRDIGESGQKGCFLVTVQSNQRVQPVEFRALDVMRWENCICDLSSVTEPDAAIDMVGEEIRRLHDNSEGRPLAVRVSLRGSTAVHDVMRSNPQRWANEIRGLGSGIAADAIWIEKVRLETAPLGLGDAAPEGPLAELQAILEECRESEELLCKLRAGLSELDDLQKKLPAELREGAERVDFQDPAWLRQALEFVQPLLRQRLRPAEDA